ncbi:fumarylacetoacetate hydrolase family protein [uncultured Desulfobacter sp.]|uniref:fumarylacetoacetate hydrolase family protein n=1 Tax=uncultured Desulfobacter sp. TaxID=240139 RepID=UPI002AAB9125|nr:fumarylacetoacetate hydrolase family protein [uncultured Desulfobacter sp.]
MSYQHVFNDGSVCDLPVGKVVCVGRNYVDHIKELDNPMPTEPILFIKPATSLQPISQPIVIPDFTTDCHNETELSVLIGKKISKAGREEVKDAVAGYGVALDLTLRDIQAQLKKKGLPWEKAKAFDGSCPISPFIGPDALANPQDTQLKLVVNGAVRQNESTRLMINPIFDLIAYMTGFFTLLPGDIVLTGTPAGVAGLKSGDRLELTLDGRFDFSTSVA